MTGSRVLPDGAVVRPLADADLDVVARLVAERGEPDDGEDLRLVAATEARDGIGVVERDGQVVATATLLDEDLRIGSVTLPIGQLELVATATQAEHRGYIRALADWCHRRSTARGHLLQVVLGIPYFYRQFGYAPAVPLPSWPAVTAPDRPRGTDAARQATPADIPAMARLQDQAQRRFDVAMAHQPDCWEWLVARPGSQQWVVERDGQAVGCCRSAHDETDLVVGELAAVDASATDSLLGAVLETAPGRTPWAADRRGIPGLDSWVGGDASHEWLYVRAPDPAVVLEALRPELSRRLQESGRPQPGSVLLSFYRSHLRLDIDEDGASPVTEGGPLQGPVRAGGSGMPPEAFPELVLGGVDAVVRWHRDVHLGEQEELLRALFPPVTTDVLTFYLPT